jgi:acetyl-CoA synthetase (ADP-forming)
MTGVKERLAAFLAERSGQRVFPEPEVKGLLRQIGIPVSRGVFVRKGEALPPLAPLSFPLVAKTVSRGITSKSDAGGVRLGIGNRSELERACRELLTIEGAEGVLVEEMATPGTEVIVGGTIDPQFGPVVMFGLGGLFVELFRDVAFALAPTTHEEALRLVRQVRGAVLLEGFRGRPPLDRESLARIVVAVSELIGSGLVGEIDLNPVVLHPTGAMALDAKMERLPE